MQRSLDKSIKKTSKRSLLIIFVIVLIGLMSLWIAAYINQANHIVSTPQKTWRLFLLALAELDTERIQTVTTSRGFENIIAGRSEGENLIRFTQLAEYWASSETIWHVDDENIATVSVPTPGGSHIFIFIRESHTWKLDRWVRPDE